MNVMDMKTALVGYTGFVGSNLSLSHTFDALYNSRNIEEAYGTSPDLLVYSGVRAEMFIANKYPEEDFQIIENAMENIRKIAPGNVVLISTIGVYVSMLAGDENTVIDKNAVLPYGRNRLFLEEWVVRNYPRSLIVRLPALFGENLKKNFIYDMIKFVPAMLKEAKYNELLAGSAYTGAYQNQGNGFYKCVVNDALQLRELKDFFREKHFSALNFTDSRSRYQFFNLENLWKIIGESLRLGIPLLTVASEPIEVSELYRYIFQQPFVNEFTPDYPIQNLKSVYADKLDGNNGYLFTKAELMKDIKEFVLKKVEWTD